ncbi:hypothetical protein PIB30_026885 [Stylosanthes scabra]|uniref:Ubiquitin-like protease family profile domain-containing protein n=1 Tax=Stylosanthes scabra TaxID=79078 RepID=A0ABU6UCG2_9FABA|nr:hypothetical protein [Stylosanthes scabra]
MNCNNHWILLVFETKNSRLICLDSMHKVRHERRILLDIKKLVSLLQAVFLEQMFLEDSWYENPSKLRPTMSDYKWVEPNCQWQQCGL